MKNPLLWYVMGLLLLTACGTEYEAPPDTFSPSLTFVLPSEEENLLEDELLEEEEETGRTQIYPQYALVSSYHASSPTESFGGENTMDGTETTAWVAQGSGFGAGEWLEHHFAWHEAVQEIWIYNGHGNFPDKYTQITEIALTFSSGVERIYGLSQGWNMIVLDSPISSTFVRLTILNGDEVTGQQACVGEMKIYPTSSEPATEQLGKETVLKNMGALGDCSNISPQQALAFAQELQEVMDWAERTAEERSSLGEAYTEYTGEALLFAGGDGIPVLYYDYDFLKVDELFVTETDVVVWDGTTAKRRFFQDAGSETNINWILPGYVYQRKDEYFFGLTEYDRYGSGSFGLIAIVGFQQGTPRNSADYVAFLSHNSRGAYTYAAELADYGLMTYLSEFPLSDLETMISEGEQAYFEFNGSNFYEKNLSYTEGNYNTWLQAIRQARIDAGYEQVTEVQSGEVVLAGLLTLASGYFEESLSVDEILS